MVSTNGNEMEQKKLLHMLQCKGKKLLGVKLSYIDPEAAKRNSRL
jgi:hypothetical protein